MNKKIAIYTAIFGDYDSICEPRRKLSECDYFCFTDNPNLKSKNFQVVLVNRNFSNPVLESRYYKIIPPKELREYEYIVWIDGRIQITDEFMPSKFIKEYLVETDIAAPIHSERNCIYKEAERCIELQKENKEKIEKQISKYKAEKYPEDFGLAETGLLLRRNNPQVLKIMKMWWKEILKETKRDQLSFNYIIWKSGTSYTPIPINIWNNNFFTIRNHKSVSNNNFNYTACIIIPTLNNSKYTIRCFESIAKFTDNYLIIWVDDHSLTHEKSAVENYLLNSPSLNVKKIFNDKSVGFIKSVNKGLKIAKKYNPEFFVIQNNDTEVSQNWLETMSKIARENPEVGLVGPLTNSAYWQTPQRATEMIPKLENPPNFDGDYLTYSNRVSKLFGKKFYLVENVHMLSFFSVLIKTEVIDTIGFLSEDYGLGYGDDDDYCVRAQIAGYKLAFVPGVFVFHNHGTTFKNKYKEADVLLMRAKNAKIFEKKYKGFLELKLNSRKKINELEQLNEKVLNSRIWKIRNAIAPFLGKEKL